MAWPPAEESWQPPELGEARNGPPLEHIPETGQSTGLPTPGFWPNDTDTQEPMESLRSPSFVESGILSTAAQSSVIHPQPCCPLLWFRGELFPLGGSQRVS